MTEDSLAWETENREVAYECPGFDIVHEDVTLPDGTETDFDYLADDPAVAVLPFTSEGDVVLVEEWRQAVGRVNRALPAGGVEDDDVRKTPEASSATHQNAKRSEDIDLATAAHRELAEETGYEAESMERLGEFEPANGITDAVFHYFVARGCEPTAEQNLDFDESIRVTTQAYDALLDDVLTGDVRDGRTALGVLRYELGQ